MKRVLGLFFGIILSFSSYAYNERVGMLNYSFDFVNKTAELAKDDANDSKYEGNIVIPDTVELDGVKYKVVSIGREAFMGCTMVDTVTVPEGVTRIRESAFEKCKLSYIKLPSTLKSIDAYAFEDCQSLDGVEISDIASWCSVVFEYIESNPINFAKHLYVDGKEVDNLIIPEGLIEIKDFAFCNCESLKSLSTPSSLMQIGTYAFYNCVGLEEVDLAEGISVIAKFSFYNCNKLSSIVFPEGVTFIGYNSFYSCQSLTSLELPSTVAIVDEKAFYNCTGLSSLLIKNGVKEIGKMSFTRCVGLTSLRIPGSVKKIGYSAFHGCEKLTSVSLAKGVEEIGDYSFNSCSQLKSFVIPSTAALGRFVFGGCNKLDSLVNLSPTPQEVNFSIFPTDFEKIRVYVMADDAAKYKVADVWKYMDIRPILVSIENVDSFDMADGDTYDSDFISQTEVFTYKRTFGNTSWQPYYLPVAVPVETLHEQGLKVAYINNFNRHIGKDELHMEIVTIDNGILYPNMPYLVRADSAGEKTIQVNDAQVLPAICDPYECNSMTFKFTVTGTYESISPEILRANGFYIMSGGEVNRANMHLSVPLKAERWYLQITPLREMYEHIEMPSEVKIQVFGEEEDVTAVDEINSGEAECSAVYDLGGRKSMKMVKGVNIMRMNDGSVRKVLVK